MSKLAYIVKRMGKAVIVILAITVLSFLLIRMTPGDPALVMAGEAGAADQKYIDDLRHEFGLDKPLYVQLARYMEHVVQGDLGYSYRQHLPVTELIGQRLPQTLLLTGSAMLLALVLGVGLGTLAAVHAGGLADTAITSIALLVFATPSFWLGLMAMLLFSVQLDWLPLFGMMTIGPEFGWAARAVDVLRHLALPATTLGLFFVAIYARLTRASMLEIAELDFVRTARAKGLAEQIVLRRHAFKNAAIPLITVIALDLATLVTGCG